MTNQRPISKILSSGHDSLRRLTRNSKRLQNLNSRVRNYLPAPLNSHCHVANLNERTLVLMVDSPIWATKIRLFLPKLIKTAGDQIDNIEIKVRPLGHETVSRPSRRPNRMSESTSKLLIQLANSTEEQKLKNALKRLARHSKGTKS